MAALSASVHGTKRQGMQAKGQGRRCSHQLLWNSTSAYETLSSRTPLLMWWEIRLIENTCGCWSLWGGEDSSHSLYRSARMSVRTGKACSTPYQLQPRASSHEVQMSGWINVTQKLSDSYQKKEECLRLRSHWELAKSPAGRVTWLLQLSFRRSW